MLSRWRIEEQRRENDVLRRRIVSILVSEYGDEPDQVFAQAVADMILEVIRQEKRNFKLRA